MDDTARAARHQRETMGNQPRADFRMHTLAPPKSVLSSITARAALGTLSLAYLIKKVLFPWDTGVIMRLNCTLQHCCRDRAISLSALLLLSTGLVYIKKAWR